MTTVDTGQARRRGAHDQADRSAIGGCRRRVVRCPDRPTSSRRPAAGASTGPARARPATMFRLFHGRSVGRTHSVGFLDDKSVNAEVDRLSALDPLKAASGWTALDQRLVRDYLPAIPVGCLRVRVRSRRQAGQRALGLDTRDAGLQRHLRQGIAGVAAPGTGGGTGSFGAATTVGVVLVWLGQQPGVPPPPSLTSGRVCDGSCSGGPSGEMAGWPARISSTAAMTVSLLTYVFKGPPFSGAGRGCLTNAVAGKVVHCDSGIISTSSTVSSGLRLRCQCTGLRRGRTDAAVVGPGVG
jgi:hypothetical protein